MRTETVCFCVTNILSGGVDSCSPGPRLACCDPAYFSLEFPDPVCRSASPFPGPFSGPGKEVKAEWLFFFISVSAQISRLVVYTCSFRMRLPWQVVKWRCSVDSDPASRGSSSSLASLLAIRHTISSCFWFAGAGHKREWLEGHSFCIAGRTASGAVVT